MALRALFFSPAVLKVNCTVYTTVTRYASINVKFDKDLAKSSSMPHQGPKPDPVLSIHIYVP